MQKVFQLQLCSVVEEYGSRRVVEENGFWVTEKTLQMASGGKFKGNKDSCYTCSNPIMSGTEFIISWSPKILPLLLSVSADSKIEWEEEMVCEEAEACMNHRERCEL